MKTRTALSTGPIGPMLLFAALSAAALAGCASEATDVGGTACEADTDCPGEQVCSGGRCVEAPCGDAGTCPPGTSCLGGRCVNPQDRCTGDDDCPGGRCVDGECFANECEDGDERPCENECGTGVQRCAGGVYRPCSARSSSEVCDGADNDCDGDADELLDCTGCEEGAERACQTECGSGQEQCVGGAWRGCDAPRARIEICGTGVDENCDGRVDEGCDGCADGDTRRCETECGEGVETCSDSTFGGCDAPTPRDEICDGQDNDCDGTSDEGVVRDCGNACGAGTEQCADGAFAGCTAPENCACEAEATPDVQSCGVCGFRQRECAEGMWGEWGACDEGESQCQPGDVEMGACGNCGTRRRQCGADCRWGDWSACAGELECAPGTSETRDCAGGCGQQNRICDNMCGWGEWDACDGGGGELACAPGDTQEEACGNCGTRQRACGDACVYDEWGPCLGEGVCAPDDEEVRDCGGATAQTRTCTAECAWGEYGECTGDQCEPGQTEDQACGNCGTRTRTCTDARVWGAYGACQDQGVCAPGAVEDRACGSDVGICETGVETRTCNAQCAWNAFGVCRDEVGPRDEICGNRIDEDCDGYLTRDSDQWEPNDSCADCRLLEGGQEDINVFLFGTIDYFDDVDYYCFNADDGFSGPGFREQILVMLEDVPAGNDYDIYLYRNEEDCNARNDLASSIAGGNADESIEWTEGLNDDDSGTYIVEVKSLGDQHSCEGEYKLTINGLR